MSDEKEFKNQIKAIEAGAIDALCQESRMKGGLKALDTFAKCLKELEEECPSKKTFSHEDIQFMVASAKNKIKKYWSAAMSAKN